MAAAASWSRTYAARPAEFLARRLIRRWAASLGPGGLSVQERGQVRTFGETTARTPCVVVRRPSFYIKVAARGEVGLGESYVDGDWDCDDLAGLLSLGLRSAALTNLNGVVSSAARAFFRRHHRRRANTLSQSPANVQDHFDAGNRVFELMLGPAMLYTCAFFDGVPSDLAMAEERKFDAVRRELRAGPGDHVLDMGCGFGGLAIHLARAAGCRVTGISLSPAQLELGRARVRAAGLDHLVTLEFRDYRQLSGTFDGIAVIGMIENVGQEYLAGCMEACSRLLAPGRRMVVDVMTTPDRGYVAGHEGDSWLQRYIFPGGSTPSLGALASALGGTRLLLLETRDIGLDYALTCRAWGENFASHEAEIGALGFDERFVRSWRYWLALGEAAFTWRHLSAVFAVYERLPGPHLNGRASIRQWLRERGGRARRSNLRP